MRRRYPCAWQRLLALVLLVAARAVADTTPADSQTDYSEYDAILALDDAQLAQLMDGWHGGMTIDNAVADEDGDAYVGADLRYQFSGNEISAFAQAVDSDLYRARLQYSHLLSVSDTTRWRGHVSAGYEKDAFSNAEFDTDFDDQETDAALALSYERDFDAVLLGSRLQARWRRFEREGEGLILDQPTALDVEKAFRSLAWNLTAQWQLDRIEQALWLQATRVTDMDVSACFDALCFAADAIEENFTLYEIVFDQRWYLTARHRDGISLVSQLAGYSASVDHLPVNYQFSIGGMYSVRGYDEAIAGGDEMALWRNELRLPWYSSSTVLATAVRQHAYVFYDWGMVWQHAVDIVVDARSFELLPEAGTRLCAAGVGIDLALAGSISLRLEYAVAQAAIEGLVDTGDSRIHAVIDWRTF